MKRKVKRIKSGHPMIVPPEVWRNTVVNFDHLVHREKRAMSRVPCYGPVAFHNKHGKIVGAGGLRDLNEKSGGFEIRATGLNLNEILYLEFLGHTEFLLMQVKVVLKRIQLIHDKKLVVGVEFVNATTVFQEKLAHFLKERRVGPGPGFDDTEII